MKNSIMKRLVLYFAVTLIIFAAAMGLMFTLLFANTMSRQNKADLQKRAETIAGTLVEFMEGNFASSKKGHGGSGHGGFSAFLNLTDDIAMGKVWLVDQDTNLITSDSHDSSVTYDALPPEGDRLIQNALNGKTGFSESFSSLVGSKTITVCVPATGSDGSILAAVLLHASVNGMQSSIANGLWILTFSVFAALILSIAIAVLLSRRFIAPIKSISQTAGNMADGDYRQKTGIQSSDEIGELANTIDRLSMQLLNAQNHREAMEQERMAFYSDISHELRTPVTVILGSLETLQDKKINDEAKVQEYYGQMIAEANYMRNMVNDLLDFSKLQNKEYHLETELLNLSDILSDVVRGMRRIADQKSVTIDYRNPNPLIEFSGNYEKLRQMFLIVMDNAVKFSPGHSIVTVHAETSEELTLIRICDQGPGIEPGEIPHIFDRFYRSNSKQNPGGTGIGLAIAKQIADRHHIHIHVKSQPDNGTCFEFIIQGKSHIFHSP